MLISLTCLAEPFHPGIRGIWDSFNYCLWTKLLVFMQSRETQITVVKWTNAGVQTKGANEPSFVDRPPAWRRWRNVKTTSSAVLSLGTVYFSNNLRSADEIVKCEHLTKTLWKKFHTVLSVFEDVITPTLDEKFSELWFIFCLGQPKITSMVGYM